MLEKLLIFFVLSLEFGQFKCHYYYNDPALISSLRSDRYLLDYYNRNLLNQTLGFLELLSNDDQVNSACRDSLKRWMAGIENTEPWALKFLEATGKSVNGRLTGSNIDFGNFDFCTSFIRNKAEHIDFDGHYCLVSLETPDVQETKRLSNYQSYQSSLSEESRRMIRFGLGDAFGVCKPSTCEITEIAAVFNRLFEPSGFSILAPERCTTPSKPITNLQIASICLMTSLIALCISSCFVENEFLSHFSIARNFQRIYSNTHSDDDSVAILHGFRCLQIFFSISTHTLGFPLFAFFPQFFGQLRDSILPRSPFFGKFYLLASWMFLLGGFFSFWTWYDAVKSRKMKFNLFNFFWRRYQKIAISISGVILISFLLPLLGGGPYFPQLSDHFYETCRRNFWKDFLLISNFQKMFDMCSIPFWYLSADFQMSILNYFLIYNLIVRPKLGLFIAFVQFCIISFLSLLFIHQNKISFLFSFWSLTLYDLRPFEEVYFDSLPYYGSYLFGILVAFMVKRRIRFKIFEFPIVRIAFAMFALTLLGVVWVYPVRVIKTGSKSYFLFFLPIFEKIGTLLPMAYAMYAILMGYFAPLRKFFSLRVFVPWSRLSFAIIMGQFSYLIYSMGTSRVAFSYAPLAMVKELITSHVFIFILGNFISLAIEQPALNLLESYTGFKKRQKLTPKNR